MWIHIWPEMKSGEVRESDHTLPKLIFIRVFAGAKMQLPENGNVLLTIEDRDKDKILPIASVC